MIHTLLLDQSYSQAVLCITSDCSATASSYSVCLNMPKGMCYIGLFVLLPLLLLSLFENGGSLLCLTLREELKQFTKNPGTDVIVYSLSV